MKRFRFLIPAALALLLGGTALAQTELTLGRFFGACEQAGTDIQAAVGEACIIQSIINAFSADDNGVTVNTLPTDWGNYYDQLKAMYASGNPPDVHVIHKHAIPEFASLGALADLTDDLAAAGIDTGDWTDAGRAAVSYDGRIYGVPMDVHANLWYVNMDLMRAAGLVNDDGTPMVPHSPEELLQQAKAVKDATGKDYLTADFSQFPIGVRLVLALVWQQDSELFANGEANVDSAAAKTAVDTILSLFDGGYADPTLNYNDSMQTFMSGEAAVLVNGDWVVNSLDAQIEDGSIALKDLYVADFPTLFQTPATWADSHTWAIPSTLKQRDPAKYDAALQLLKWIYDHDLDWARTGHLAISKKVVQSDAYAALPHRSEYANTVNIARDVQPTTKYDAIQDVLNRELQAIWLTGKDEAQALSDANSAVQDLLQ
jgi:multiple sugar transport system substrate-binding protein